MARPRGSQSVRGHDAHRRAGAPPLGGATPQSPYLVVLAGANVGEMHKVDQGPNRHGARREGRHPPGRRGDLARARAGRPRGATRSRRSCSRTSARPTAPSATARACSGRLLSHGDKILLGSTTILKFSYHDKLDEMFQRQMSESALRDGLTKTFNKRYLTERLESEFTVRRPPRHAAGAAVPRHRPLQAHQRRRTATRRRLRAGRAVEADRRHAPQRGHPRALRRRGVRHHLARHGRRRGEQLAERLRRAVEEHAFVVRGQADRA